MVDFEYWLSSCMVVSWRMLAVVGGDSCNKDCTHLMWIVGVDVFDVIDDCCMEIALNYCIFLS